MSFIYFCLDYLIHLDVHLTELVQSYGMWTYFILGAIIFCETGLVVTPFLPGDSLLFVVGTLSALGAFDVKLIILLLLVAAFMGNMANYLIGRTIGEKILKMESRFIKKEYIDMTHSFYEKHGGKAIILSRFIPLIRTFAPFVAGIGKMNYGKFMLYNASGAVSWILSLVLAGYFFGNIPLVKNNFTIVIFSIIFISIIPAILTFFKKSNNKK